MGHTSRARLSENDLVDWGRRVGEEVEPPLFVALRGPLGAGKSVLARAIADGAGVRGRVPSPTFNLCFRYTASRGREVVHLDLYRLHGPNEVVELGWESLGASTEVVLVEWPERAERMLPENRWDVTLAPVAERPDLRDVSLERVGNPSPLPALPTGAARPPGRDT